MTTRPGYSCALAPTTDVVDKARLAERLGYQRVWLFDSPALHGDVWVALARIASGTDRIGLATGVAVPSLRHPMVTASAISSIHELAPDRLIVAVGTGYTARHALGHKPTHGPTPSVMSGRYGRFSMARSSRSTASRAR